MIRRFVYLLIVVFSLVCIAENNDVTAYWADEALTALEEAEGALSIAYGNANETDLYRQHTIQEMSSWLASNTSDPNYSYISTWKVHLEQQSLNAVLEDIGDARSDVGYARGLLANMSTNNWSKIVQLLTSVDGNISNIYYQVVLLSNYVAKASGFIDFYSNRVSFVQTIKNVETDSIFYNTFDFLSLPPGNTNRWARGLFLTENLFDLSIYAEPMSLQALKMDPDGDDIDLTNEGMLLLHNYVQNDRQFYVSLNLQNMLEEKLDALIGKQSISNTVDLTCISNYLYNIQRPFYGSFNELMAKMDNNNKSYNPYNASDSYKLVTGLLWTASSPDLFDTDAKINYRPRNAYKLYQQKYSNVFSRIEIQLMALNGLFPTLKSFDELSEGRTESTLNYQAEELTNAYNSAVGSISSTSNGFAALKYSLSTLISALDFREYTQAGQDKDLIFTPGFSLPGTSYEIPSIEFDYGEVDEISEITTFSHGLFEVVWYLAFGLSAAFGLFFYFRLISKLIVSLLTLISTLLSK